MINQINVYPKRSEVIYLGQQGDNLCRCVLFDKSYFSAIEKLSVESAWVVKAKRSQDAEPYVCPNVYEDLDYIRWEITSGDVEFEGTGSVQVEYYENAILQNSIVWTTKTYPSLVGVKAPVTPLEKAWREGIEARLQVLEKSPGGGSGSGSVGPDFEINDIYEDVGMPISADMDLLSADYCYPGVYYSAGTSISSTLQNCPTNKGFKMIVLNTSGTENRVRILIPYTSQAYDKMFMDRCDGDWTNLSSVSAAGTIYNADIDVTSLSTGTYTELGSFVLPKGKYMVTVSCIYDANDTGYRELSIDDPAHTLLYDAHYRDIRPAVTMEYMATIVTITLPIEAPDDDYTLGIYAQQNSGETLLVNCKGVAMRIS